MPTSNGYAQSRTRTLQSSFSDLEDLTGFLTKKSQYSVSSGGYADIWVANSTRAVNGKPAGQKLAVKVIRSFTDSQCDYMKKLDKRLRREVVIWKGLEHKNILPLLGVVRGFGPYVSMVCPWMAKGSLTQYLGLQGSSLSHQRRLQIIREVASGLTYLHSKDVIHGDLSGSNILLDDAERVCISDFGLATIVAQFRGTSLDSSTVSGAIRWMAPECVFGHGPTTPSSDVYSFGSIMYQVFTSQVPYVGTKEAHVILLLDEGRYPDRPPSSCISEPYWDIISRCWNRAPSERPSMNFTRANLRRLRQSPRYPMGTPTSSCRSLVEHSPLFTPLPPLSSPATSPVSARFLQLSGHSNPSHSSQMIIRTRNSSSPTRINNTGTQPLRTRPRSPPSSSKSRHPLRHSTTWPPLQHPTPIPVLFTPQSSSLRTVSVMPPRQSTFDYATCVRCGHTFKRYLEDTDDGDIILIHQSTCTYHSGEVDYSTSAWSCCARGLSSPGCCTSPQHHSSD
ncbi:Kinase-like protein [Pleurotus pulmonarius]